MIRRYAEIRDYMTQVELDDIDDLLLTPRQDKAIDRVKLRFADLDTITKALQLGRAINCRQQSIL